MCTANWAEACKNPAKVHNTQKKIHNTHKSSASFKRILMQSCCVLGDFVFFLLPLCFIPLSFVCFCSFFFFQFQCIWSLRTTIALGGCGWLQVIVKAGRLSQEEKQKRNWWRMLNSWTWLSVNNQKIRLKNKPPAALNSEPPVCPWKRDSAPPSVSPLSMLTIL